MLARELCTLWGVAPSRPPDSSMAWRAARRRASVHFLRRLPSGAARGTPAQCQPGATHATHEFRETHALSCCEAHASCSVRPMLYDASLLASCSVALWPRKPNEHEVPIEGRTLRPSPRKAHRAPPLTSTLVVCALPWEAREQRLSRWAARAAQVPRDTPAGTLL